MGIGKIATLAFFIILYTLITLTASAANGECKKAQPSFTLALGVEYTTGKYGTDATTDAVTIPLKLIWNPTDQLDLSLTLPYLYQSNSLTTTFGMGRFRTAKTQSSGATSRPVRIGSSRVASSFDVSNSQSGIGDLVLNGGIGLFQEGHFFPGIRPEAYVKFPTADKNNGLGTGEFDGGIGVMFTKGLGDWNTYFEGLYNIIGKSENFQLRNYFSYEAAVEYQVTEHFLTAIAIKGATNPGEDSTPPLELRMKAHYTIGGRVAADAYLSKGLTDETADYGAGAELSWGF